MDDALRALERAARAAPADRSVVRRYRAALRRVDARRAAGLVDALEGGLARTTALGDDADPGRDRPPRWRRVPVGGAAPLALPPAPAGPLGVRWRAEGRARWASAAAVLVEAPGGALVGLDPRTGAVAWEVPSAREAEALGDGLEELEAERAARLPWAVAGWGAAELGVRVSSRLAWRRTGTRTRRGRGSGREVVGRDEVHGALALHLVVPAGGAWSASPPVAAVERGEAVGGGALRLAGWDDALYQLALDPASPTLAVRWRDPDEDWVVLAVHGLGGEAAAPWADDAGWRAAPDEDPHPAADAAPAPAWPRLEAGRLVLAADGGGEGAVVETPPGARLLHAAPLDDGALVRGAIGAAPALWVARAGEGAPSLEAVPLADALEGRALRAWDEAPVEAREDDVATALVAGDLVLVQVGGALVAFGAGP